MGGNPTSQLRYLPYGAPRTGYPTGSVPTDYRFTGQRSEEAALGSLYDYGARFHSPVLGRFLSSDTIVPSPGNPQSLNRYAYALNNPLKYIDPSGHDPIQWIGQFISGALFQWGITNRDAVIPLTPQQRQDVEAFATNMPTDPEAFQAGRMAGALAATAQGVAEIVGGVGVAGGGTLSFATVVGPMTGASEAAVVVGAVVVVHGAVVTGKGIANAAEQGMTLYAKTKSSTQGHHPWPKYLGGPEKQPLLGLPTKLHEKYHAGLDKIFSRYKGSSDWNQLSAAQQKDIVESLLTYSQDFDADYATHTLGAVKDVLKANGVLP